MLNKILVPLDGSNLAEAALAPAIWLAKHFNSTLVIIHVIEKNAPAEIHGNHHLTSIAEANHYLESLVKNFPLDLKVETHIHEKEIIDVARSIADHTQELKQDLVVMCTHGSGNLRQWVVGSIAQQVVGLSHIPILLIQPEMINHKGFDGFRHILVALDEEPEHDCGLVMAGEIGIKIGARLSFLTVVEKWGSLSGNDSAAGRLSPITTAAILDLHEEECKKHLEEHALPWKKQGLQISCQVKRGDPVSEIAKFAAETKVDMIVLGTHGKKGMQAFWSGSVAPRLSGATSIPLLFVPVCEN